MDLSSDRKFLEFPHCVKEEEEATNCVSYSTPNLNSLLKFIKIQFFANDGQIQYLCKF